MDLTLFLTLVSGIGWMVVYEECIRLGFRDNVCCMPIWALGLNIAWEAMYTGMEIAVGDWQVQTCVNLVWCAMDVAILVTWLRFGREESESIGMRPFLPWTLAVLLTSAVLQAAFAVQFPLGLDSECWSAFLQNLLMSVLFVIQLERRSSLRGTSMTLAMAKWLGTLAPTITLGILEPRPLVLAAGLLCSVFDLYYIWSVAQLQRMQKPSH